MSARKRPASRRRAARANRRRARRPAIVTVVAALAASAFLLVIGLLTAQTPPAVCAEDERAHPAFGVHGWRGEQLRNAATIIRTGQQLGFARDGQIIGVMTAMGESSLRNIDYGDWETSRVTNPDGSRTSSIGLFQQQEWWGTVEERMDPATAATLFYERLGTLPGWQDMEPTHAINRVQINSDPEHYAPFEDDATAVVEALSGPCPGG